MEIIILTIFPDFFESFLGESLLAKAIEKKLIKVKILNIRDYTLDKHHKVDDAPYGGGAGMILQIEPLYRCLKKIKRTKKSKIVLLDPRGRQFDQKKAISYSKLSQLILICGRYEGVDDRINRFIDERISIGPYVINGGETAAQVIIEAAARLVPGFVGRPMSLVEESFNIKSAKFEYPQYTRPAVFQAGKKKLKVPSVLLSGNHSKIKEWREKQSK